MNVLGANSTLNVTGQGTFDGLYYHIDKNARFVPHTAFEENSARYQYRGGFAAAPGIFVDADPQDQGYGPPDWEGYRVAGSATALSMTRRVLDFARTSPATTSSANSGFVIASATQMLDVIGGAIGNSYGFEPAFAKAGTTVTAPSSQLVVYAPPDDAFWDPGMVSQFSVYIVSLSTMHGERTGQWAASLVNDSTFSSFTGVQLSTLISSSVATSSAPLYAMHEATSLS